MGFRRRPNPTLTIKDIGYQSQKIIHFLRLHSVVFAYPIVKAAFPPLKMYNGIMLLLSLINYIESIQKIKSLLKFEIKLTRGFVFCLAR